MDRRSKKLRFAVLAKRAQIKRRRAAKAEAIANFLVQILYRADNDNFQGSGGSGQFHKLA